MADSLLVRLSQNAAQQPSKTALTFLGSGSHGGCIERQMTYADVVLETDSLAISLLERGLKKGDMAVLVYPPSLDFMLAFIACLKAGIVAVPVFPPNPSRRDTLFMFSRIVESCSAKYALTSASYNHMKKLFAMKDTLTKFRRTSNPCTWPEHLNWIITDKTSKKRSKSSSVNVLGGHNPTSSDLAFLQYTSGSTSEPKGVMITHGNLGDNLTKITDELKAAEDTVCVSWLPQYHDMGLIGSYLGVLYCGGCGYYMSPLTFLQRPVMWLEAVSRFRGTHLQAPNFAFKLTARKFDDSSFQSKAANNSEEKALLDLSSVRHIINAAEPVTEDSINAFLDAFCPFGLKKDVMFPTYGLAEHTVFVCSGGRQRLTVSKHDLEVNGVVKKISVSTATDQDVTSRLIGCGFPSKQNVDVRIVNPETTVEVAENEVGEIWIRSDSKAAGYYKKEMESQSEFRAHIGDSTDNVFSGDVEYDPSDGYLRSGDLGFLHKGELFICGRIKDLIIVGGRNYYPQDIEGTAEASTESIRPGCSAAFTIDPISGGDEEVAMVLELREVPKAKNTEEVCRPIVETIRGAVNQEHSLAISHIILLSPRTVPKTTSGKIARTWCRKAFLDKTLVSIYSKSFGGRQRNQSLNGNSKSRTAFEIEQQVKVDDNVANENPNSATGEKIRSLDKKVILKKLINDISQISNTSPESIPKDAALVTIMDSLSLSQFKGMLEAQYFTKISDEYLFREETTVKKLTEVVKLGYAPDDTPDGAPGTSPNPSGLSNSHGGGGIAGALGCPPGVVCCAIM